ncbi:MAG: AmmeMemoRadiSam system protein A [Calditrichia bacterium]
MPAILRKIMFGIILGGIVIFYFNAGGQTMSKKASRTVVGLGREEKVFLLQLARQSIISMLESNRLPETQPPTEKLKKKYGAFVTLHKRGELRGCIGYIEGLKPLYVTIMEMAKAAAFQDPRFPAVSLDEVDDLEIEISVMSELVPLKDIKEIEIGTHGLVVQRGLNRGLLLPQVAVEWGWDTETFLEQTCRKAGLPAESWKDPRTEILIFSAEIFSEEEFPELYR